MDSIRRSGPACEKSHSTGTGSRAADGDVEPARETSLDVRIRIRGLCGFICADQVNSNAIVIDSGWNGCVVDRTCEFHQNCVDIIPHLEG